MSHVKKVVAVVTVDKELTSGGAPIFIVEGKEQQQEVGFSLEKILDATAHQLPNGVVILVKH